MTVPIMPVSSYTKITRPWRIVLIDPSTRMEILIPAFKFLEVAVTVVSLFNDVKTSILFSLVYVGARGPRYGYASSAISTDSTKGLSGETEMPRFSIRSCANQPLSFAAAYPARFAVVFSVLMMSWFVILFSLFIYFYNSYKYH